MQQAEPQENQKPEAGTQINHALRDNTLEDAKIPISGRFDQYRSSYWSGAIAALGLRYASRPFLKQNWDKPDASHFETHKYSGIAGAIMYGVAGYYAYTTWNDMKQIMSEAVAWEKGKDPKDVTFRDFWNSDNTVVKQTINNYATYNMRRLAVNAAFFLPFLAKPLAKKFAFLRNPELGVDLGVAANAAYLFSDILTRRVTPFEELQTLIDTKVNHTDHFSDKVQSSELLDVYERHAQYSPEDKTHSFLRQRGTPQWDESCKLFDRMAELINQTYGNEPMHEKANFGFSKFIYMMGHGMIDPDHIDRSLVCVEIANLHGPKNAEAAMSELRSGSTIDDIRTQFNVPVPQTAPAEPAVTTSSHHKIIEQKQHSASFSDRQQAAKQEALAKPATLAV